MKVNEIRGASLKNIVELVLRFFGRKVDDGDMHDGNLSSYLIKDHIFQTTRKSSKEYSHKPFKEGL